MAGPCQRWRTALQGVLTVTRLKKPSDKGVAWCEEAKPGIGALRGCITVGCTVRVAFVALVAFVTQNFVANLTL